MATELCIICAGTNGGHFQACPKYGGDKTEAVNHPAHYGGKDNPYEAIKIIDALGLDFCRGNALKYLIRAGKKAGQSEKQDLEKAAWYINWRIQQLDQN